MFSLPNFRCWKWILIFVYLQRKCGVHLNAYRNVEAFQYLMSHIQAALLSMEAWINSLTKVS